MNIHEHGIEIRRSYISDSIIEEIKNELASYSDVFPKHGIRNANKKFSSIEKLSKSSEFTDLASSILGSEPQVVRVIFFDKTPDKNWLVSWHQDKIIAVNKKTDVAGWGSWSIKDNIYHVQPSIDVLNKMITFRLHLDDADKNNGCLKIIPKSHNLGILSQIEVTELVSNQEKILCEVHAGDVLLMRPHILHSSSKANRPAHRRVVHIEYSNYQLPENIEWV